MANVPYDELRERRTKAHEEAQGLVKAAESEERDFTDDEQESFDKLCAEVKTLDARMARLSKLNDIDPPTQRKAPPEPIRQPEDPSPAPKGETRDVRIEVPDTFRVGRNLRAFTPERLGSNHRDKAYQMSRWWLGFFGHEPSRRWSTEHGWGYERPAEKRVHTEGTNWQGGVLVPDEIDNLMIDLRETRGVARQVCRVVPMGSDHMERRRRTGGLTAYAVGEGDAITESTKSWDWVTLTPRKWGVISTISSELNEDSVISVADDLVSEMAYAHADKEDEACFNGDGTSTYHGIVGIRAAFTNLTGTIANIAGLTVGTGNAYSELTLADFNGVVSKLPQYADGPEVRWVVHKTFYHVVMQKLMYAAGGNTTGDITAGTAQNFLGYPVMFSQVMPKTEANSQVCALLGNFRLGVDFGDRRGMTVAYSDSATVTSVNMFTNDEIAVRSTARWDINVHDVGNQSATAASRLPGPIVGLITAAA